MSCCVKYDKGICVESNNETDLVGQTCVCHDSHKKVNSEGHCIDCMVAGCVECSEENVCSKCQ